jgi:hypothetical protein
LKPTDRAPRANKGKHYQNQNGRTNNNPARPQNQPRTGNGGSNQNGKNTGSKTASQLWLDAPSQTLTSHIPTVGKRNSNGFSKRNKPQNGNDSFNGSHKNKNQNSEQPRNQRTWNNGKPQRPAGKRDEQRPQNSQRRAQPNNQSNNQPNNRSQPTRSESSTSNSKLDAFNLFCAYHLGIGPDNTYRSNNLNQVAQRFGVEPGVIRQAAKDFGFDPGTMLDKEFDLALAQLDIQVAPEGISKIELAKGIYDEFLNAPDLKRDWGKIIEEDKKENAKVFGR